MNIETTVFIAILGAIVGSFLNMVIHRLPLRLKWTGRSRCPQCKHTLTWPSLIPVLSYVFLMGKCRFCRVRIPLRYLLVEVAMSALFVMFWYQFGPSMAFVQASIFASVLMALFCIDFDHYILPDKITLPLILTGPLWHLFDGYFLRSLLAGIVGFMLLWTMNLIGKKVYKRDVLGGGDMMLAAGIGTWWGLSLLGVSLYMSFLVGGIFAVGLLIMRRKGRRDEMPFGPSMIIGWLIAFVFHTPILLLLFGK
jgi:leader peptidase (prepilin peptidase) / N-methyltransferase